jgi:hypothetical protein
MWNRVAVKLLATSPLRKKALFDSNGLQQSTSQLFQRFGL